MISVQNHQQQLNGNKLLIICMILIGMYACSTAKKVAKDDDVQIVKAKDKPNDEGTKSNETIPNNSKEKKADTQTKSDHTAPKKGEENKDKTNKETSKDSTKDAKNNSNNPKEGAVTKIDTVVWKEKENQKPIEGDSKYLDPADFKEVYTIAVFIPFGVNAAATNDRFAQYYGGLTVGAHQLEKEEINLIINVYDSEDKTNLLNHITNQTDLIVGPYDEEQLKTVIEFGKQNKIPTLSPWFSLSKVEKNPYYIQLRPTIRSHFNALVKHVVEKHKLGEIALVGRNTKTDQSWFKFFQTALKESTGREDLFTEYFVVEDSLTKGNKVFNTLFQQGKRVILLPNYSFKDEEYIKALIQRLNNEKGNHKLYVYGMPLIKDSDKIDYEYFSNLNMRIVVSEFLNDEMPDHSGFARNFYDLYTTVPESDAYEAYDMILLAGRSLKKYGKNFQLKSFDYSGDYLQTQFDIQSNKGNQSNDIDFFENKHLNIIEFVNGKFKKVE